jgi:hypothetical protein
MAQSDDQQLTVTGPNMIGILVQNLITNLRQSKESQITIDDIYNHAYNVYHEDALVTWTKSA